MDIDWQQAVALGLAAMAVGYVGWRARRRFSAKTTCASCVGCSVRQAVEDQTIVPIESLTQATVPIRDSDTA